MGIVAASVVTVLGVGGIAFAATGGFGMLDKEPSSNESVASAAAQTDSTATEPADPAPAEVEEVVPGEEAEDGNVEDSNTSGMDTAFENGKSVECTYTYEAYDAKTTMRSREIFRIDQQAQGGLVHVIRGEQSTLLWVDGMTHAEEFDTDVYENQAPGRYPTFDPADFDAATALDPDVCVEIPAVGDEMFTLPADMDSVPGTL